MSKRAIILAGGKGTRLKPYTVSLPKPLVPVGDIPILEIIIRQLAQSGFDHITITVNHMADIIKAFFGDGSKWNLKIDYSLEEKPLSTMGPLKLINDLPENFLIMNGDVLTDLDYGAFYDWHVNSGAIFSLSSYERTQINNYGVLDVNEVNNLTGFREKPATNFIVSMGVYMASKPILDHLPYNQAFGFDQLMMDFLEKQEKVLVKQHKGYWLDIGRPDDYETACNDIKKFL